MDLFKQTFFCESQLGCCLINFFFINLVRDLFRGVLKSL